MPISKYFHGHGEEVARKMKRRYGARWKEVFYATARKQAALQEALRRGQRGGR